jgi:exodeoxyribonuclease VII small subunit
MQNKNIGFEASMERLEKIVAELSREGITLDESLALYEEGIALAKNCNARLEETERKIKILKVSEYGEISEQDFSEK